MPSFRDTVFCISQFSKSWSGPGNAASDFITVPGLAGGDACVNEKGPFPPCKEGVAKQ